MEALKVNFRRALRADLPPIVRMLADDPLGSKRETYASPLPACYSTAFEAIDRDPNNELVVAETADGTLVGVLQITFIPYLSHRGGWRALVEGVRVAGEFRSRGIGRQLLQCAIRRAKDRGCHMVQLTTDKTRSDAMRFYGRLGFVASHEGLKLHLG